MNPGQEVRLKNAYIVKCTGCKKNEAGEIVEVYCEYDPNTKSGMPEANRKVKGTLHWVSCDHCLEAEVRLYDISILQAHFLSRSHTEIFFLEHPP